MTEAADYLIDRRRLKRRLASWQIIAVVAVTLLVIALIGRANHITGGPYVARISVEGIIYDDRARIELIRSIAMDDAAKAAIIFINSPGGTVVGGENLFAALRRLSEAKPVATVIGEFGTSAAYMTALGTERIFASEGTITGSIGVLLQTTDITELLASVGIKPETLKSGPLKAQPNPFEPFTSKAREAMQLVVTDLFAYFVDLVSERRGMPREKVLPLADGRVFTGHQAIDAGLIDEIGGDDAAMAWLVSAKGIPAGLPVRDVVIEDTESKLVDLVFSQLQKALFSERVSIDVPVSVWHPSN